MEEMAPVVSPAFGRQENPTFEIILSCKANLRQSGCKRPCLKMREEEVQEREIQNSRGNLQNQQEKNYRFCFDFFRDEAFLPKLL